MSDNPYSAPQSGGGRPLRDKSAEQLQAVGTAQRALMYAILVSIGWTIVAVVIQIKAPSLILLAQIGQLAIAVACMVCVFVMARAIQWSMPACILVAICGLVPCLNLLLMLIINSRATALLKRNGIRVGLMGANPRDLARLSES